MIRAKIGALLLGAGLVAAACGGTAAPQQSASSAAPSAPAASQPAPKALTRVSLRLAWLPEGDAPPFALGKLKGFYSDAGLDVDIQPGKGSPVTAESVANGNDTFGWADTGAVIKLISKGAPIKVIAIYQQQSPMALAFLPPSKLDSAADLKGSKIYTAATSPERLLLPAVLATSHLTMNDIKLQIIDANEEASVLAKNKTGYVTGYDNADVPVMRKASPDVQYKSYASFGVNVYNLGLVTSLKEIQDHPDVVKSFVAASSKAWDYAAQHPDEAVADLHKMFPDTDTKALTDGFAVTKALLYTDSSKGHPAGWMASQDWAESLKLMQQYGGVQDEKSPETYYTNEFIPAQG